jgi:predicted DNA-binding protein (MmcQ/YjbR family)
MAYNKGMDFSFLLEHHHLNPERLLADGFSFQQGLYEKKQAFSDPNFYGIIRLGPALFEIRVYETSFDEEYIPFTLKTVQTSLVAGLKEQVNTWVQTILEQDFDQNDVKNRLIAYCKEKYHSELDHPFDEDPYKAALVLRVEPHGKWYALFMDVKASAMGLKSESDIQIVNLKEKPEEMKDIVDNVHVFPSYHMNKTYWITLILDETIPFERVCELAEKSYFLVSESKKKKSPAKPHQNTKKGFEKDSKKRTRK